MEAACNIRMVMGCTRNCNAVLRKAGRFEWWVKVQTSDGMVGWVKDADRFQGIDALAA